MEQRIEKVADEQDGDQSSRDPHRQTYRFKTPKK